MRFVLHAVVKTRHAEEKAYFTTTGFRRNYTFDIDISLKWPSD